VSGFRHAPLALRRAVRGREQIVIRQAGPADAGALRRLSALAERPAPLAPVLLAESDGSLIAAVSTSTGDVVVDPFVTTSDVVALLRFRAGQLDRAA
jgi:hypothetical protein